MRPRNKYLAVIFALFGGSIGLHKFYLRDAGGVMLFLFLIFMTASVGIFPAITGVLGFFDALKLLFMNEQEFNRKYNRGFVAQGGPLERRRQQQMSTVDPNVRNQTPVQTQFRIKSNPFKASGLAKYKDFDLEAAIEDFNKGLEIDPNDVAIHFNLACAYSLTEKKDKSFYHLAKAVELGFNDTDRILTHDDLAYLRIQPEFDLFRKSGFRAVPRSVSSSSGQSTSASSSTAGGTATASAEVVDDVLLAQLNRLSELRKKGILSEEEFTIERKKLMRNS